MFLSEGDAFAKLNQLFGNITLKDVAQYRAYWETINPTDEYQIYLCWLYAMVTVNMSEKKSTPIFEDLADLSYRPLNQTDVRNVFVRHRAGMHNMAAEAISEFSMSYWANPGYFRAAAAANAIERDRLLKKYTDRGLKRIGFTKMSFLIELLYPLSANVVCIDRHVARWFEVNAKKINRKSYIFLESHWLGLCQHYNVPSPLARHILWDKCQESLRTKTQISHDLESPDYWAAGLKRRLETSSETLQEKVELLHAIG